MTNYFLALLLGGLLLGGCVQYARTTEDTGRPLRTKITVVDGQKWPTTFLVGKLFDTKYEPPDSHLRILTETTAYPDLPLGSSDEKIIAFYLSGLRSDESGISAKRISTLSTDVGNVSVYRLITKYPEDNPKLFAFYQERSKACTVTLGFYSEDKVWLDTAREYINKMYHAKLIPVAWNKAAQ